MTMPRDSYYDRAEQAYQEREGRSYDPADDFDWDNERKHRRIMREIEADELATSDTDAGE
jgi:hypothetical protein